MSLVVPVLPSYALALGVDQYVTCSKEFLLRTAERMVTSRLLGLLEAEHPDEKLNVQHVLNGCMIRVLPPHEAPIYYSSRMLSVVEVTFPHPGGRFGDPYEITPVWPSQAVMCGGPDDGASTGITNLAPEHLRTPYYGAQEELLFNPDTFTLEASPSIWAEREPGVIPALAVERTLLYTRSGYDLETGWWHYAYQGG